MALGFLLVFDLVHDSMGSGICKLFDLGHSTWQ